MAEKIHIFFCILNLYTLLFLMITCQGKKAGNWINQVK
jgi:hypothetical protein